MGRFSTLFLPVLFLSGVQVWADPARCKIVFAPGAFGHGSSSHFLNEKEYFADYEKYFREKGCATHIAEFQENGTIELRARMLRDQTKALIASSGGGAAIILAHSQGALDARFAIKTLGLKNVSAVIMIGAPNHGTPLAEWAVEHRKNGSAIYWIVRLMGRYDLRYLYFVGEMTSSFLEKHEDLFAAVPGVRYASARGRCVTRCSWPLRVLDWISGQGGLGNNGSGGDGIVPAQDQAFGDDLGEYDLDHITEVSQDPFKYMERRRFLDRVAGYLGLSQR